MCIAILLDHLEQRKTLCAALPKGKRFSPGLATATFAAVAAGAGNIAVTDVIPNA
jgi:hypothetical protein